MTGTDAPPSTWGRMTMCEAICPSHAFLDHPGNLRLLLRGESLGDLLTEAGRALGHRMCDRSKQGLPGPWLDVSISADGPHAILGVWLNRLLQMAQRDRWAPVEAGLIRRAGRSRAPR